MMAFAALVERLESARDEETAARVLAAWLTAAPDPGRGVALGVLLGVLPVARAGRLVVAALAERLDPVLLAIGRETAGELLETVALMWPGPSDSVAGAPNVADIAAGLADVRQDRATLTARLAGWLDALAPAARVALLRLAAGQLSGLLRARTAQAALARRGGAALTDVEAVWHAASPPYEELFAWLAGRGPRPEPAARAPFGHLPPVRAASPEHAGALDAAHLAADAAWDGLRVLVIAEAGERRLYSRRGEDLSHRFPELLAALEDDVAAEGVVIVRDPRGLVSQAALEARLARRRTRTAGEATLMLHDLLAAQGENLRSRPFRARRAALEALVRRLPERAGLSPLLPLARPNASRDALADACAAARALGAAGVVLKRWDAPYAADAGWVEVRCEPLTLRTALLYLEWAPEGAVATVGVWDGPVLAPVAKVALEDRALSRPVTDYAGAHPFDRFGPVLQVAADADEALVLEIAFDAIETAPRRKAGLVLRGARLISVCEDARPGDVAQLEDLRASRV